MSHAVSCSYPQARYAWSTADGTQFDGPTAVASHIGVSAGFVCDAAREAFQQDSTTFQCNGHVVNRRPIVLQCKGGNTAELSVPDSEVEYLLTLTPFMQVYAHLHASALRFYPNRKLLVPNRSQHQMQTIRTWSSKDLRQHKFDLAQVWSLHSPSTFTTPYSYRRALLGEPQETPTSELGKGKYPSLTFFKVDGLSNIGSCNGKLTVAMSAEDILKFLLSDFARKGQFDEIFEPAPPAEQGGDSSVPVMQSPKQSPNPTPQLTLQLTPTLTPKLTPKLTPNPTPERAPARHEPAQRAVAPPPRTPPPSPRKLFAAACLDRMRELEQSFSASAELEAEQADEQPHAAKRRRLAHAAIGGITRVLFDANKLVLDKMIQSD